MAREPSAFWTFVQTRSMSPASLILWKIVQVPPTSFWTLSTTGADALMSVILPSQVSPTIILGNSTRLGGVRLLVDRVPGHGLRGELDFPGALEDVAGDVQAGIDVGLQHLLLGLAHPVDVLCDVVEVGVGQIGAAFLRDRDHSLVLMEDHDGDDHQRDSRHQDADGQKFRLQFDVSQHGLPFHLRGTD